MVQGLMALLPALMSVGLALPRDVTTASVEAGRYRVELAVELDEQAGPSTPAQAQVDFDDLLGGRASGLIHPHTLVVTRDVRGEPRYYPVQFSASLYYANAGWVAWLVDDPAAGGRWFLEFGMRAPDGGLADPPYLSPVGVGDELHLNGPEWRPIDSPGYHPHPIPVDWNGDDLVDIISRSHGTNRLGMPTAGISCWRNIGTNEAPRFAPPMRLYAEGVDQVQQFGVERDFGPRRDSISEDYIACDVFDWLDSGRPDLITLSSWGGIKVYRNTGRLDAAGLPMAELAQRPEYPPCISPGRYPCLRVVDWDGSGRPSVIVLPPSNWSRCCVRIYGIWTLEKGSCHHAGRGVLVAGEEGAAPGEGAVWAGSKPQSGSAAGLLAA